ncbi:MULTISPECIES: phytoene desaturase family protein [Nocardioides]|uniref:Pyridine nucleotide-disulfide oxidoreductase domain-containing protein 2 n=1 Tax=Nocardioides vastitatis TaxID=2568655 RepID=A0ABW0ZJ03_9ACTN|nr:NAD(P)/FAD-dependent oxidoreductase [Nocardioides sp.]THI97323.1 NAD(P)/FAD-dependent oxidoreductase [Nocardioides sp.]
MTTPDSHARTTATPTATPIDREVDAVVIGSGPNGLVAANLLADAGWQVLVLEEQPRIGGAVASDGDVHEGYIHDTFSSFYPLAVASPTIRALGLEQHGLRWTSAPAAFGSPFASGDWALVHPDRDATADSLDKLCPGDGDAWLRMCRDWDAIGEQVIAALLTPFPPVRAGAAALARLPRVGGLDFVREMIAPMREVADRRFRGEAARMLLAANSAHADISMDGVGSTVMGWLLAMIGQDLGYPVPVGGAGAFASSMARRLESAGGRIVTDCRVTRVVVDAGRAVAVRTGAGEEVRVRQAVVADVSAPALYADLLAERDVPARIRRHLERFTWDYATIKVDWALSAPVPWATAPVLAPGTVHVAETIDELAVQGTQIAAGLVPSDPFLIVGQMAAADPTRAPADAESLWAYTHLPHDVRGDAGPDAISGRWDHDENERMADRMQMRIEKYAPGLSDRILSRRVLGPREMQARDANLVNGALNGGTANLHQQLVLRPVPGLGRAETPIKGLYLGSASAHPGGGVHGACGSNAARAALGHARLRRLVGAPRRVMDELRSGR